MVALGLHGRCHLLHSTGPWYFLPSSGHHVAVWVELQVSSCWRWEQRVHVAPLGFMHYLRCTGWEQLNISSVSLTLGLTLCPADVLISQPPPNWRLDPLLLHQECSCPRLTPRTKERETSPEVSSPPARSELPSGNVSLSLLTIFRKLGS